MNPEIKLYPLQFVPQLKEKVWGGTQLATVLNKEAKGLIGESWEISGVDNSISEVNAGSLKGKQLTELIDLYAEALVGAAVYKKFGNQFPLLFKFIDAQQDLSVQLHPDDALAKMRHNAFGKTEMWYVLKAEKDARLIIGFQDKISEKKYTTALGDGSITSVLNSEKVAANDSYYIAPGTVHAIGAGVLLAEIQQTSDITYRIYDWDRPDTNGQLRQLHTKEALAAINFETKETKITYEDKLNARILLKKCPYFATNKLRLTKNYKVHDFSPQSFKVYMCVEGEATLSYQQKGIVLSKGQTVLVPACCSQYMFETENATFLEVYIP